MKTDIEKAAVHRYIARAYYILSRTEGKPEDMMKSLEICEAVIRNQE